MPKAPRPEHLRRAIDQGQTGSKVSHSDPAAAPLGTDEEAAGTPVASEDVARAARDEIQRPAEPGGERNGAPGAIWIMIAGGILLIVATAVFMWP